MRVVSVNIGARGSLTVKGKSVETGIFKRPCEDRVRVDRFGIAGDTRVEARKGGEEHHAICAYPIEHYAHWQRELGDAPYPCGQFGENLTVEGALETDLRIGDVLECGSVRLQVAQPRIPCRKLAARMGVPSFARSFLRSRRVGYYLRVLVPGELAAGDRLRLVRSDPAAPTVDTFVRVSQFEYWDSGAIEGLLRAPDLMTEWRETLEDKLGRSRCAKGWFGLRELCVDERVIESADTLSVYLRCPRGRELPRFRAGQSISVVSGADPDGRGPRRRYAVSSSPADLSRYRITVRLREAAPVDSVARWIHEEAREGARLLCGEPKGAFGLEVEPPGGKLLFASEGIGVAPIASMLHAWAAQSERAVAHWLHFDRSGDSHVLRRELDALVCRCSDLDRRWVYCEAPGCDMSGRNFDGPGALYETLLEEVQSAGLSRIYAAGSEAFVARVRDALSELGVPGVKLCCEPFSA